MRRAAEFGLGAKAIERPAIRWSASRREIVNGRRSHSVETGRTLPPRQHRDTATGRWPRAEEGAAFHNLDRTQLPDHSSFRTTDRIVLGRGQVRERTKDRRDPGTEGGRPTLRPEGTRQGPLQRSTTMAAGVKSPGASAGGASAVHVALRARLGSRARGRRRREAPPPPRSRCPRRRLRRPRSRSQGETG